MPKVVNPVSQIPARRKVEVQDVVVLSCDWSCGVGFRERPCGSVIQRLRNMSGVVDASLSAPYALLPSQTWLDKRHQIRVAV